MLFTNCSTLRGYMDGADKAVYLRDHAAQPGEQLDQDLRARVLTKRFIFWTTKGLITFVTLLDVTGSLFDESQGQLITGLIIVGPVDQAMLSHHQAFEVGILLQLFLHHKPKIKPGALPGDPAHLLLEDLLREALLVLAGGNGDHGDGCM